MASLEESSGHVASFPGLHPGFDSLQYRKNFFFARCERKLRSGAWGRGYSGPALYRNYTPHAVIYVVPKDSGWDACCTCMVTHAHKTILILTQITVLNGD